MAIKEIVRMGNPILRNANAPIEEQEFASEALQELIQDMKDTMDHLGGIGIAAPQIGVNKQICIIDVDPENPRYENEEATEFLVICNPIIKSLTDEKQGFWEGCLSVPGLRGYVERPSSISLDYKDQLGHSMQIEAHEFLATVFQHELDHLFGKLYIDRIKGPEYLSFESEYSQFHTSPQEELD